MSDLERNDPTRTGGESSGEFFNIQSADAWSIGQIPSGERLEGEDAFEFSENTDALETAQPTAYAPGEPFESEEAETAVPVTVKSGRKNGKLIVGIAAAALGVIVGVIATILLMSGRHQPQPAATSKTAQTATIHADAPITTDTDLKVGFIFLHDENSTYDKNFIDAVQAAQAALGLDDDQIMLKTNIPEGNECYDAAAELVDAGCDVIFADSFGHEPFMLQAAQEFPDVQFYQAAGTRAHTENLANYHNAFASIHEGRFLTGVAAGMKLNEMIDSGEITAGQAKLGFVGAFPYAEVISAYTAFFLGARYVCPAVTMEVRYTNSWYDESLEKEAANALIRSGCVLISQYTDSMGAPTACEAAGVPNVSYNGSTISAGADTYLISSRIDWKSCFESIINAAVSGTALPADWVGTLADGSVVLESLNTSVAASGTQKKLDEVRKKLINGSLHVFDTSTFTVNGAKLTSYKADVDYDSSFTPDTEAVSDGYFHESEYRSAPYFDIIIDGITVR